MSAPKSRDDLDGKLAKALQAGRLPPAPSASEPSDDDLLLYVEGKLPPERAREVEKAVEQSPYSKSRVRVLGEALAENAPEQPSVVARAASFVFHLGGNALQFLRGSASPVLQAAPALRSAAALAETYDCYEFMNQLGDIDAMITVDRGGPGVVDVKLKLSRTGVPVTGARISLEREGRVFEAQDVERDGSATFRGLGAARYRLGVHKGPQRLGLIKLDFLG